MRSLPTAMAIQALAPYYQTNAEVKVAVDKALDCLSALQTTAGGYLSWNTLNSESCAQVIVALTALGIDPASDARFIKNGCSVVDALLAFYTDGGFRHTMDGELNGMATEQGYYALAAFARLKDGKTGLYDMSDVTLQTEQDTPKPKPEDKNVILSDVNGTGVTVTGTLDILTDQVELEVRLLTSGDRYEKAKAALKDGKFTLYDLYLLKNNVEIQPDGMITVSIPVPEGYDASECKVFYLDKSGNAVDVNAVFKDGRLVFDTDHLIPYAVWQPVSVSTEDPGTSKEPNVKPNDNNSGNQTTVPGNNNQPDDSTKLNGDAVQNPQTGDTSNVAVCFGLMLLSLFGLALASVRKRKEKQE